MSTIDLDAFEAFVEAMDDVLSASGHDIGKVLRHLDNNGFEVRRKPVPVVESVIEPAPMVPVPIPTDAGDEIPF